MMDKTMLNLTAFGTAVTFFKLCGLYRGPTGLARTKGLPALAIWTAKLGL